MKVHQPWKMVTLFSMAVAISAPVQAEGLFEEEGSSSHRRERRQDVRRGQHGGDRSGGHKGGRGNWQGMVLNRILHHPEMAEKIGLSQEQVQALKKKIMDIQKRMIKLRAEMEIAGMEQAELMSASTINEKALLAAVEETGEIRTQMAKLQVKQLLLVKSSLSAEQIENVKKMMRKHMKKKRSKRDRKFGDRHRRDRDRDDDEDDDEDDDD